MRILTIKALAVCAATTVLLTGTAMADIGRVKISVGEASIERGGELIPAKPGLVLDEKDVLVTGANGRLGVTFVDNSRFSAGPNSRVELTEFTFNPTTHDGGFETDVQAGTLAIISGQIAKKTPDAMKVRTPTTILGVRGTEFVVEVAN